MALRDLSVFTMYQISGEWLEVNSRAHALLDGHPMFRPMLANLRTAHDAIREVQPLPDEAALELQRAAALADAEHDRLARGIHGLLTATAEIDGDDRALELRSLLLPRGLAVVNLSYVEEAGVTRLAKDSLTPAHRDYLAQIRTVDGTLLETVLRWFDTAERLGEIEKRRAKLRLRAKPKSRQTTSEARSNWIRMVRLLLDIADMAQLDEEQRLVLFGVMQAAQKTADRRVTGARMRNDGPGDASLQSEAGEQNPSPVESPSRPLPANEGAKQSELPRNAAADVDAPLSDATM